MVCSYTENPLYFYGYFLEGFCDLSVTMFMNAVCDEFDVCLEYFSLRSFALRISVIILQPDGSLIKKLSADLIFGLFTILECITVL